MSEEVTEKGSLLEPHEDPMDFKLFGFYNLVVKAPPVTWRHRLYWRLRKLIDWIHP